MLKDHIHHGINFGSGATSGNQNTATCGNSGSDAGSKMCCGGSYSDDVCNHERTQYHYHWSANTKNNQISFRCSATAGSVGINRRVNTPSDFQWSKIIPCRLAAKIEYTLKNQEFVKIAVFNCMGRVVRTLISGGQPIGNYSASWDGNDAFGAKVCPGAYIVSVNAGDRSFSKTLLVTN